MSGEEIISLLPYSKPFLFADAITKVDDNSIIGEYTFSKDEFFYKGHFKNYPITPGVILTEVMAQIGVVCFGIFLLRDKLQQHNFSNIVLVSSQMDFLLPVYPEEKVVVISEKIYFRLGKLKCKVEMKNERGETVCKGIISGMVGKNE